MNVMIITLTNSLGEDAGKYCCNWKHIDKYTLHFGMEIFFCMFVLHQATTFVVCPEKQAYKDKRK